MLDIYSYLNPSILGKDYRRIMTRKNFVVFMNIQIIYSIPSILRGEARWLRERNDYKNLF